jgi:hypothetical protein
MTWAPMIGGVRNWTKLGIRDPSGEAGGRTLADFDFAFQPAIKRSRIETKVDVASMRDTGCRLTARLLKDDSPQAGTPRTARAVNCTDHFGASRLEVYMLGQ